jgi:hypothetical protein
MTAPIAPQNLNALEGRLLTHLGALSLAAFALGLAIGGWRWGVSALAGVVASLFYYKLLGVQVRATLAAGRQPHFLKVVVSLLGRQAVCACALLACFLAFGQAWWACLGAMLVARHWVIVLAAWPAASAPAEASP